MISWLILEALRWVLIMLVAFFVGFISGALGLDAYSRGVCVGWFAALTFLFAPELIARAAK